MVDSLSMRKAELEMDIGYVTRVTEGFLKDIYRKQLSSMVLIWAATQICQIT